MVKAALAWLVCAAGCGFQSSASPDAGDARPDAPADAPPDAGPPPRTRAGLIGLWEFDETGGAIVADTSDASPRVPLTVVDPAAVTFSDGTMTLSGITVVDSAAKPHLDSDVIASGAVTFEAWIMPALASQGLSAAPVVVGGLCSTINSRNLSILQVGTHWVGRVRTTTDVNGGPDLTSTADITAGAMTHLVIVSDATQRILYVNGRADAVDPMPSAPLSWDQSYRMVLGNEISANRQWLGTFALVAIYAQALTPALVMSNYLAGPAGR